MSEQDQHKSPVDRSKRPRLEEDEDVVTGYERRNVEDRHPKRQAVPDPATKAPSFAGDERKDRRDSGANKPQDDSDNEDRPDHADGDNATNQDKQKSNYIAVRSLVSTKDAGIIIGRGGRNVNEIREYSSARVNVTENVQGAFERILTVVGPAEAIAKAYRLVAEKILHELSNTEEVKDNQVTIRLLIADTRMGNLIGKSGTVIRSLQEESGARINASEEPLPMSTERTLTIQGTPKSIQIAVDRVAHILVEHPDRYASRQVFFTPLPMNTPAAMLPPAPNPRYNRGNGNGGSNNGHRHHQQHHHHPSQGGSSYMMPPAMPGMPGMPGMPMPPFFYQGASGYGGMTMPGATSNPGGQDFMPMNSQSQQIYIPNDMVGCIIGKGGSKINEIRQMSGSHIKIADPVPDSQERLITITGTQESNQMALYMVYSRLESEKARAVGMH
ncbi:hypothetical protein DM01DRAFT_1363232 [Hesseltinella vesiculosa]|uniref:K Homology domain-containing protein n=1 Tax=Hesseltinella vesiculosa TaxID=101127 RepID=A0A1X2GFY2_9FUNG|nr:hypothetical protein DM01DRAFT_1363232 [Hesseltinella vesiculosa]